MLQRKSLYGKMFLCVSALGVLFVLTEVIMHSLGRSICPTEGCKIAAQHARYGDISILLIGLAVFCVLTLLSAASRYRGKTVLERYINYVLIVSLACEGFFAGYQAFSIHVTCVFCLMVFGVLCVLGMMRILAGEREVVVGFASLAAVFSLFYLVLPAGVTASLPGNDGLTLFYGEDCRHCTETMGELQANSVAVKHLDVKEYGGLLKIIGIEHVPTLLVSGQHQKIFLTGQETIRRFLSASARKEEPERKPLIKSGLKKTRTTSSAAISKTETTPDVSAERRLLTPFGGDVSDEGMCKQDEACK